MSALSERQDQEEEAPAQLILRFSPFKQMCILIYYLRCECL